MRLLPVHGSAQRRRPSVHIEELVAAFRRAGHEVLVVGPALLPSGPISAGRVVSSRFVSRHLPKAPGD